MTLPLPHTPQPRKTKGETDRLYAAIRSLRKRGFLVIRKGRTSHFLQRGTRKLHVDDTRLVALAHELGAA